jgi:hypothetical protein
MSKLQVGLRQSSSILDWKGTSRNIAKSSVIMSRNPNIFQDWMFTHIYMNFFSLFFISSFEKVAAEISIHDHMGVARLPSAYCSAPSPHIHAAIQCLPDTKLCAMSTLA